MFSPDLPNSTQTNTSLVGGSLEMFNLAWVILILFNLWALWVREVILLSPMVTTNFWTRPVSPKICQIIFLHIFLRKSGFTELCVVRGHFQDLPLVVSENGRRGGLLQIWGWGGSKFAVTRNKLHCDFVVFFVMTWIAQRAISAMIFGRKFLEKRGFATIWGFWSTFSCLNAPTKPHKQPNSGWPRIHTWSGNWNRGSCLSRTRKRNRNRRNLLSGTETGIGTVPFCYPKNI